MRAIGAFAAARAATQRYLRVLAYHGVEDRDAKENADGFQVAPDVFARQLQHLARRYRVVALDDVIDAFAGGAPLPPRAALITFDDGYKNNFSLAAPILLKMGLPAAFFITTGFLDRTHIPWWYVLRGWISKVGIEALGLPKGTHKMKRLDVRGGIAEWEQHLKGMTDARRQKTINEISNRIGLPIAAEIDFMTWDEARKLRAQGFALGAHTVSHANLGVEEENALKMEIETSIARISSETGAHVESFAYPYGRATDTQPAVDSILRACGIALGFTTVRGLNRAKSGPLRLRRLSVSSHHDGPAFEKLLALCN
jgi:peptidoglycan/xylan/chitin deacetylase (PgdA/CDA1 family)